MKTYICTKTIHAVPAKMVNGVPWPDDLPLPEPNKPTKTCGLCDDTCGVNVKIDLGYLYTTSQDDMYPMFMERDEFEKICRSAEDMTFGDALEALKDGERVARKGWNGKGMYVFLAHEADFVTDADLSAYDQLEVEVADMLVMKTAQDTFQPGWLASQADMLAEDWYIVE